MLLPKLIKQQMMVVQPKELLKGEVYEKTDLSGVPKGVYIVKMENETGVINKKIIIAK